MGEGAICFFRFFFLCCLHTEAAAVWREVNGCECVASLSLCVHLSFSLCVCVCVCLHIDSSSHTHTHSHQVRQQQREYCSFSFPPPRWMIHPMSVMLVSAPFCPHTHTDPLYQHIHSHTTACVHQPPDDTSCGSPPPPAIPMQSPPHTKWHTPTGSPTPHFSHTNSASQHEIMPQPFPPQWLCLCLVLPVCRCVSVCRWVCLCVQVCVGFFVFSPLTSSCHW